MESKEIKIVIDGREYPCRVTMGALMRYNDVTGKEASEIASHDVRSLVTFIWCCTVSACRHDRIEFEMSLEDFADSLSPDQLNGFYSNVETSEKKTVSSPA